MHRAFFYVYLASQPGLMVPRCLPPGSKLLKTKKVFPFAMATMALETEGLLPKTGVTHGRGREVSSAGQAGVCAEFRKGDCLGPKA